MLNTEELQTLAEMIPARAPYAVIASWADTEESADDWNDWEHVRFCHDWVEACDVKRQIEADGLAAYIIEPEGPHEDIED